MPSVLIVDDEPNIRRSLEGALGREGYDVDGAASLAAARASLRAAPGSRPARIHGALKYLT